MKLKIGKYIIEKPNETQSQFLEKKINSIYRPSNLYIHTKKTDHQYQGKNGEYHFCIH